MQHLRASRELPEEVKCDSVFQWATGIANDEGHKTEALHGAFVELTAHYLALLKRFVKIARISDGFQHSLKEVNTLLDEAARRDYLTGLSNRRDIIERIEGEISRAKRHGKPFSILIADIDRFKQVNDRHGHDAGDAMLKLVAEHLRRSLRLEDHCARWGGEEFLVCLPETPLASATAVAEKLRETIGSASIDFRGSRLSVTVSFGVSCHTPDASMDDIIRAADHAMLNAKRMGRNRVEAAEEHPRGSGR